MLSSGLLLLLKGHRASFLPRRFIYLLLLILPLILGACKPIVTFEQPAREGSTILKNGESIGQTFVARYEGLAGIAFYIKPQEIGDGALHLTLHNGADELSPILAESSLPLNTITQSGYYRFNFTPQKSSSQRYYYARIELKGQGNLEFAQASGEAYINGALYKNDTPQDAQSAFRLIYEPQQLTFGLLKEGMSWLLILAIGGFLFVLPGLGLLHILQPARIHPDISDEEIAIHTPIARIALAVGLSLAIYPILFLWTHLLGLNLGPFYAWIPPILGGAIILWRIRQSIKFPMPISSAKSILSSTTTLADIVLLFVLGLIFATRFWAIRNLEAPMWGDSYQHTVIAQLLVNNKGLFNSWQPYAELTTFTYHFGFHSAVAVFHWISRLPMPQATLWTGQLLNGLAVFALYPLALYLGRDRWAGVFALLIAGLLSAMPSYYVNWGRYTQLAGQVILPSAYIFGWIFLSRPRYGWKTLLLSALSLAGLGLTHYRVLIFVIILLGTVFIVHFFTSTRRSLLSRFVTMGTSAGLVFLPWFIHVSAGRILDMFARQLTTPASALSEWTRTYNTIGDLASYLPIPIWILMFACIAWGLWRRETGILIFTLGWLLILVAANPNWIYLPGTGALSNFAVFIAMYIPAGTILGSAVGWLLQYRSMDHALWIKMIITFIVLALGFFGARARLNDPRPAEHALVTRPDVRAAQWISENTPPDSRLLVNAFFAFGNSVLVGSDGGWWLPYLAGRLVSVPPINYAVEAGPRLNNLDYTNQLWRIIEAKGLDDPETLRILQQRDINYIYIGQRQGRVNYNGTPYLDPSILQNNRRFRLIYHQDRVWVWARVD